jgi:sulfur carrier protein
VRRGIRRALRDNIGMDIVLNGDMLTLGEAPTILDLLQTQGLAERRVAVEVNGEIVPRGRHGEHRLQAGDKVEIVHALGGG